MSKTTPTLDKIQIAQAMSDLRWTRIKRAFIGIIAGIGGAAYFAGALEHWGAFDSGVVAPVVRFEGAVSGDGAASADATIAALSKAFDQPSDAIILYIDSPGGSPMEAERVARYIDIKRLETEKKVYTVCGSMCASAGYMVAMTGDEVFAGKFSLVGSIGTILQTWNWAHVIEKTGARNIVFKSGAMKDQLNPYADPTPEHIAKTQQTVDSLAAVFADEVKKRRGKKLAAGQNLFTGESWTASDAQRLGLIDEVATLDKVVIDKFGPKAKVKEFNRQSKSRIPFLTEAADALVGAIANRALAAGAATVAYE